MLFSQGTQFAKSILQRRPKLRLQILGIAALVLALQLLELAAAILYLKLFHAAPITLFSIHIVPWRLIQIAIMLPGDLLKIWYFWRIWIACSHAAGMLPCAVSKYRKTQMLWLSIQNFCIRTLLLQTVPLCLFAAYHLAKIGAAHPESAPWLFFAAQFVVMAVLLFLFWIYVCIGLWCTPFLWLATPQLPLWRIPLLSLRIMHGRRTEFLSMLGWQILRTLPLITFPWTFPQTILAAVLYFHIQIREAQQNGINLSDSPDRACASAS